MNDGLSYSPSSFAETVQLVENYAIEQIKRETKDKQLYYHTVDHAFAVKRRAKLIFQAIKPVLILNSQPVELDRVESLIDLCATAHDMVQEFVLSSQPNTSRRRPLGKSEFATIAKLTKYIQSLNQTLNHSVRFTELDLKIIEEGIIATICDRDPLAGKTHYSFSKNSIYQPYLYDSSIKPSIVGQIIALADLGSLGIDGVDVYLQESRLVFLEENPDLIRPILDPVALHTSIPDNAREQTKNRLLKMARFIVVLARERKARFELEIAGFSNDARQILREQIFSHLTTDNINKIQQIVPARDNASLTELLFFFRPIKNE